MKKSRKREEHASTPLEWPRADSAALACFDPSSKICTMNCGPSTLDPRSEVERRFLCDDCLTNSDKTFG